MIKYAFILDFESVRWAENSASVRSFVRRSIEFS